MLIRSPDIVPSAEITPRHLFDRRREFLRLSAGAALAGFLPAAHAGLGPGRASIYSTSEELTPLKHVTGYNNFTEFGFNKDEPAQTAHALRTSPWTLSIEGLVRKPKTLGIEDILKLAPLEERIYRLRCVEGWSMVIPWLGIPVATLLKQVEPLGSAKYVEFITAVQPETMPGVRTRVLDWPYTEGLRLDEAMHPLTLMALGLYGAVLPNQNGAPLRLVVPWKYGFKSGKSIVKIRFTDSEPHTTWNKTQPEEYGFYANVNPEVDHRRWSQASERRIGDFFKRKTLMFNGYAEQVGQLYTGMDLRKNFLNPALIKPPLFLACLAPLAYYAWGAQADNLGANPIEAVTRGLGDWALNFLLVTLAVTPLRKLTGWAWLGRLRRMLGLFVFFYAALHLSTYLWFDQFFDWQAIAKDILKRPFITVGMVSFALLLPLAATSNAFAIRRLGGRRWQELHRSVYAIGLLAVLHYSWMVKADISRPLAYAAVLGVLLGLRVWWRVQERNKQLAGAYMPKPRGRVIPIVVRK